MPRLGAKNTAVVLLLVVALVASLSELGAASFTEFFAPPDDPNSQALMPGLWSQVGVVSMGDGSVFRKGYCQSHQSRHEAYCL